MNHAFPRLNNMVHTVNHVNLATSTYFEFGVVPVDEALCPTT
jgi:hypothetical protein